MGLFNFLEEDVKGLNDPFAGSSSAFDFLNFGSSATAGSTTWNFDSATTSAGSTSSQSPGSVMAIDPQLVGTPSSSYTGDDEAEEMEKEKEKSAKLTLTINPVKVGGHGKARKGTVQSGGVAKPKATPLSSSATPSTSLLFSTSLPAPQRDKENSSSSKDDDDDELPEDWRPSPEVLAKMTSKEKRQLRNKISARNFRVRRKEYISTLEMDIAERDRLLQAIRSELGSTQSENVALRQEIAALKKALLDGRTGTLTSEDIPVLNLPPPAPLPPVSAATATHSSSGLVTPNTHKDVPNTATSPRLNAFWGGISSNVGITPVHTVLVPELSALARNVNRGAALQENINPVLNNQPNSSPTLGALGFGKAGGFDGFADVNPFTLKTLDAYRMQLWTRMASQQQPSSPSQRNSSPPPLISSPSPFTQQLPGSPNAGSWAYPSPTHSPLGGLAGSLKPQFFANSSKVNLTSSSTLSGKHLPTPPPSPKTAQKSAVGEKERREAAIATLASQTLFKRLGGAFWDAFSGSEKPSASGSSSGASLARGFDSEKVRKVLEGKAVVRVVDLEPTPSPLPTPKEKECDCNRLLEESMRSLTLGRK